MRKRLPTIWPRRFRVSANTIGVPLRRAASMIAATTSSSPPSSPTSSMFGATTTALAFLSCTAFATSRSPKTRRRRILAFTASWWYARSWNRFSSETHDAVATLVSEEMIWSAYRISASTPTKVCCAPPFFGSVPLASPRDPPFASASRSRSRRRSFLACVLPFRWSAHASSPEHEIPHVSHTRVTPFSRGPSPGARGAFGFRFFFLVSSEARSASAVGASARSSASLNPPDMAQGFEGRDTGSGSGLAASAVSFSARLVSSGAAEAFAFTSSVSSTAVSFPSVSFSASASPRSASSWTSSSSSSSSSR